MDFEVTEKEYCDRFEAVYRDEEPDERLAEWAVVEWTHVVYDDAGRIKSKSGSPVWRTYNTADGEQLANARAHALNTKFYCGA